MTRSIHRRHGATQVEALLSSFPVVVVTGPRQVAVISKDTAPLRELGKLLGGRMRMGVVATLGDTAEVLGERLCAVPIGALLGG